MVAVTLGLVLDEFGAQWEFHRWDAVMQRDDPTHMEIWHRYLCLTYAADDEPIGHHYLRDLLLPLKFELALGLALFMVVPASIALSLLRHLPCGFTVAIAAGEALLGAYLLHETKSSAELLHTVRTLLVNNQPNHGGAGAALPKLRGETLGPPSPSMFGLVASRYHLASMEAHIDNRSVGRIVREFRLGSGLNQHELAGRLAKPQSLVSKIETGERGLSVTELGEIAEALGTTPIELIRKIFDS